MSPPAHLAVGLLKKPHGIKGDVLVFPLTSDPEAVFFEGRVLQVLDSEGQATGATLTVQKARAYHRAWLLHFAELADRAALDAMREKYLGIAIGDARPLAEGEFYLHELPGLRVELQDHSEVGTVREVYEAPQGLLLAIDGVVGREHLVPFRAGIVRRVDRAARLIVITPPEGLLEL